MGELAAAGVVAFKTFFWPYPDRSDEFEGIYTVDDGVLYQIFERVADLGLVSCVHAESYHLVNMFSDRIARERRRAPINHEESRPVIVEVEAVWRTIVMAQATRARHCAFRRLDAGQIISGE